jgi:RNA recognition motif-containing protein
MGDVRSVNLAIDQESGLSWRFGFVTFFTKEDAHKAIQKLNGLVLDQCTMKVDWVTPRKT